MASKRFYAREAVVRYVARPDVPQPPRLHRPKDAAQLLAELIGHETVEVGIVLTLDTKHNLIAFHEISRGAIDGTIMHPREVLRPALLDSAAAIIVAHNHPSGDPAPSRDDRELTKRLQSAAELCGIALLDSLVIGTDERYYSFQEGTLLHG